MDQRRRNVLRAGGGASLYALLAAAGMMRAEAALASDWNQKAFEAKNLKDAFDALGAGNRVTSNDIVMTAPEIADRHHGAVRRGKQATGHGIDCLSDRQEPDSARRKLRHSRGDRARGDHAGENGGVVRSIRIGEGAGQVLRDEKRNQGHHRRMRRLGAPPIDH